MEPITLTYDVPVSRAAAFYLFVGEMGQWWPPLHSPDPARYETTRIEARVGGAVLSRCGGEDVPWGEVIDIEVPSLVVWDCWWRGDRRAPSRVTVRFFDSEWGTRVVFEHGGWTEANAASRARHGDWPLVLAGYVAHARRHAKGGALVNRRTSGIV